jgi:hypothetical protein
MQVNPFEKIECSLKDHNVDLFSVSLAEQLNFGMAYLMHSFEIDPDKAYDCVLNVIEKLINNFDKLCKKEDFNIAGYFLQSLKNEYRLMYRWEKRVFPISTMEEYKFRQEAIYNQLFTEDEKISLRHCIEKLPEDHKEFIKWNISNPKPKPKEIKDKYYLTVNAYYQRKHKIIKRLKKCLGAF